MMLNPSSQAKVFAALSAIQPAKVPEPNNSLKNPTIIKITAYPKEFPIPSRNDFQGPFANANASKRPIIIQLVIINPTKTDKVLLNS